MAARQLRWLLGGELLFYTLLGGWLVSSGSTPLQAFGLGLAGALGMRLYFVLLSFGLMLGGERSVPTSLRIGPLQALRMVLEEYAALILLFTVVQPFEKFWLGPDRLGHCAARRTPLLLIHGYQCNRGFWFWLRRKLEAAGWTVATHNLEPVFADIDGYADGIARRIDEVLTATGAAQLILVGHSMGGLAIRAYLQRHGKARVARLITLGTPHRGTRLARLGPGSNARQMRLGSSWLSELAARDVLPQGSMSIYSGHDNYVYPQEAATRLDGAAHVAISGVSHLGMAISPRLLGKLREVLESP